MNILYTCDNNYIWIQGISMISLYENNPQIEELNVYLLGENISDENKNILTSIAEKYNRSITIIDVPKFDIPESLVSARWPLSAYTRLFSGQLLPKSVDRILYLDCDTVIMDDISELESIDMQDRIVMGVKDCISRSYRRNIGLRDDDIYINAGVLLIDMNKLRKVNIKTIIDRYMDRYVKLINYADQDILNGIFRGKIGSIHAKYDVMTLYTVYGYKDIISLRRPANFYSEKELQEAVASPCIIHYTTNMRAVRPWFSNATHPCTEYFLKYKELSPWKDRELQAMEFKSQESKVIGMIDHLPKCISYRVLGMIHSTLKPLYIRVKGKRR